MPCAAGVATAGEGPSTRAPPAAQRVRAPDSYDPSPAAQRVPAPPNSYERNAIHTRSTPPCTPPGQHTAFGTRLLGDVQEELAVKAALAASGGSRKSGGSSDRGVSTPMPGASSSVPQVPASLERPQQAGASSSSWAPAESMSMSPAMGTRSAHALNLSPAVIMPSSAGKWVPSPELTVSAEANRSGDRPFEQLVGHVTFDHA